MRRAAPGRELAAAVALCLTGAFAVLVGAGRTWTSADVPPGPLTDGSVVALSGADLASGVRALGLVGLAGVVALAATRRTGRVLVGGLVLLAGGGVVAGALGPDLTAATLAQVRGSGAGAAVASTSVTVTAWPWLTALGGLVLALAGLLTVVRGRSWPVLGERYEAPAARAASSPAPTGSSERALWEALDRGEDPTDILGSSPGTRPTGEADRT